MKFLAPFIFLTFLLFEVKGQFVPALFIFGDSIFDVGNNNDLVTLIKANFPPYGRDFVDHEPTGRFCNGKLALDIIAEQIGFTDYQLAYMSDKANGEMLLIGANFASAASGYYNATAILYNTISLSQQLENYREYKNKLVDITGKFNASSRISRGIHLISAGSSDFLQNYYINPLLFTTYTPDTFSDILLNSYDHFIQNLYELGARRIGVTTLPPLGCLPAAITAFGHGNNQCVARLNNNAISFNNKLKHRSQRLTRRLSKLKLVVLDIYNPLYTLITEPAENGFAEVRRACCGTGLLETSILCNQHSIGTCSNASQYFLAPFIFLTFQLFEVKGQFVPALFIFGDSIFDVGNNNDLVTLIKANFPPYGRDFVDHEPTGRFCNGKLALDIIAEGLRFTDHQPAYMNDKANGEMLLIGANFASAASGYYNATAILYNTISLSQQLENYREYKNKLVDITGKSNASSRISRGIHLISDGSSDFLQNYYINPLLFTTYTPDTFSDILLNSYDHFIQNLYELGARRIGVATLPPLGCLPAAITAFGHGNNQCVARLNNNAISFNNKLKHRSQRLTRRLSKLKLVVLDIYNPLYTLITEPAENEELVVGLDCLKRQYYAINTPLEHAPMHLNMFSGIAFILQRRQTRF
ncbi:hypothetical protein PVK06_029246 [Gossypium arboreum]|uniref:GDSL esterase/lipase At5g22810-like n=1 Tax=Gossypium arboreum TaxID=29729 RepID=A0ABR0P635_GOSAR|nr:hypothetical protein PVK06_029246 [Gossypium arboreum]